jgi:hypothetical protein
VFEVSEFPILDALDDEFDEQVGIDEGRVIAGQSLFLLWVLYYILVMSNDSEEVRYRCVVEAGEVMKGA